ncbi:hypothetical protein B0H21DRAFT_720924 [Amylocystis lapponica]|nr:hypothetical protein B0H21DRAFT_720924 [Amylocystis lapponica]
MPPLPSWHQVFRLLKTVAVPLALAGVVNYFLPPKAKNDVPPPSLYHPILGDIGFLPRKFPVTYRIDSTDFMDYERIQNASVSVPDTTAVVLNWSRFPNVLLITSLLCGPWLDSVISEVIIWNNSPRPMTYDDIKNTGCPKAKLRIQNSPANMYFQGRYMACAQANTPYCFVQDDDYLIRPEIIQALHTRIAMPGSAQAIHLLPPHEHLNSSLREIHVAKPEPEYLSDIHTSFAWLGHGTIVHRNKAIDFISLLRRLRLSSEEMKMADNYFTILSNQIPEIWFDQDFELGGGHAFTLGVNGTERNAKHILQAARYLDSIAHCNSASCVSTGEGVKLSRAKLPYTNLGADTPPTPWTRAACTGSSCMFETNIQLLPDATSHTSNSVANILFLGDRNLENLGEAGKQHYVDHAPSHAVDTKASTWFQSPGKGRKGDVITLDLLGDISNVHEWTAVEMAWLVDLDTEKILKASTFESSSDNVTWHQSSHLPICDDTELENIAFPVWPGKTRPMLRECGVQMPLSSSALQVGANGRYFRVHLDADRPERWTVFEVWLRGL